MELLHKLGIDWRLLIAQLINFSVLLFVLYKFLYHPILNILEKRRKQIEENDIRTKSLEEKLTQVTALYYEKMREEELASGIQHAK